MHSGTDPWTVGRGAEGKLLMIRPDRVPFPPSYFNVVVLTIYVFRDFLSVSGVSVSSEKFYKHSEFLLVYFDGDAAETGWKSAASALRH